MSDLAEKHCIPCEGGISPLTHEEADRYLKKIAPDWALAAGSKELRKDFRFKGYQATMMFVNAVAWIAQAEGHHPDLEVGFNHCLVRYSTHAIGGLSENDFICASKIDKLKAKTVA